MQMAKRAVVFCQISCKNSSCGGSGKNWAGLGVTLIESLDTLYLMGMKDEFSAAEEWVKTNLDFSTCGNNFVCQR